MSGYIEHLTSGTDRWDLLAYRYYGDANRTAPLIAANRELFAPGLLPVPLILPAGILLRIPILEPEPAAQDLLPPWKRKGAA